MKKRSRRLGSGDTIAFDDSIAFDDTIAAVVTPPGEGGLAAVRVAGPKCRQITSKHFVPTAKGRLTPFLLRHGLFRDSHENLIDEITAVFMPHGRSYTGLDQVEIFCHGGRLVVGQILTAILGSGARAAEPGEFTKLAFLSGRIDLTRAEAVADLIQANSEHSGAIAREHLEGALAEHVTGLRTGLVEILSEMESRIDWPDEDLEPAAAGFVADKLKSVIGSVDHLAKSYRSGRIVKEGFKIAICGRPNAGKSSLFNILLDRQRALVAPSPGTTRDYLSEWIEIGGIAVNVIDTAGLRTHGGAVERAGQEQAARLIDKADLVLWMVDVSQKGFKSNLAGDVKTLGKNEVLVIANKSDLVDDRQADQLAADSFVLALVSCTTKAGLSALMQLLSERIEACLPDLTDGIIVTSARQQNKLVESRRALKRALSKTRSDESPELVVFELQEAVRSLDEITGRVCTEEVLREIFSKFCVGK